MTKKSNNTDVIIEPMDDDIAWWAAALKCLLPTAEDDAILGEEIDDSAKRIKTP